jgi:parallel beta-helix repeat protein
MVAVLVMSPLAGFASMPRSAIEGGAAPLFTNDASTEVAATVAQPAGPTPAKYAEGHFESADVGGSDELPLATPWGDWTFRDAHNANGLTYSGDGVTVAVADTGIDFASRNLAWKYHNYTNASAIQVTNKTVLTAAAAGQRFVSLGQHYILPGTLSVQVNGTASTAYSANLVNGSITFDSALPLESVVLASYQHRSPYYGWPMAFDALGMPQYLLAKEARDGVGGVINTQLNGTGPFEVNHIIKVDGKNDFSISEDACPNDMYSDVRATGSPSGWEYDLTELWTTRDSENWYVGVQTLYGALNRTFGFAFDFDGAASGSLDDPRGNYLDFEASHSAAIEQISYEPVNHWVASCAGSNSGSMVTGSYEANRVKVWTEDGAPVVSLPIEETKVDSVLWSPGGDYLAYTTGREIVVYDTSDWSEAWRKVHSPAGKTKFYRDAMAFSPDGSKILTGSIDTSTSIFELTVATGATAYINNPVWDFTGAIAYNPTAPMIALGMANGRVIIVDSTTYAMMHTLETYINYVMDVKDTNPVESLAWSPDGMHLLVGRNAVGYINLWNRTANLTWFETGYNLTGHGTGGGFASVNSMIWGASSIITGSDDGTVRYWNPTTFQQTASRASRNGKAVNSIAMISGGLLVGTADCTVRKYDSAWTTETPFASNKPDVLVYVDYEREYYTFPDGIQKLDKPDKISEPDVYYWAPAPLSAWVKTNMTNIWGDAFYKGSLAGEWTAKGFLEIALPRNLTALTNVSTVQLMSFTCGNDLSRPQDTVPSDYNVPSSTIPVEVDLVSTDIVTLSAWAEVSIPTTYIDASIPSISGKYHFGYHPSKALTKMLGAVPLIVTESAERDVWDTVWVDMNNDYVLDTTDVKLNRSNPLCAIDMWNLLPNGTVVPGMDGIADLSGGLLYFIGDGTSKMPYADRMSEIMILAGVQLTAFSSENMMPIPGNGEVIAFYGEFDYDEDAGEAMTHGTRTASAIAGSGQVDGMFGPVRGLSPEVTFLPICNAQYDPTFAMYFAAEGYDGKPNTGDEAQIVSVGQYTSGYGNGLDEMSQLIEFVVNSTGERILFVSPAGNDGSGYGTVASPCGAHTFVVGYTEDSNYLASSTEQSRHFTKVSELSSRGPTAAGLAKPDAVAVGWGEVENPLGASGVVSTSVGGKSETVLWKGSDLAAAVATGVAALVFQAYKAEHGSFPTTDVAMDILRSTAKDAGYDTLTQGSGFLDASAAVSLASETSGLHISAEKGSFGTTFGTTYDSFVNVLAPGSTDNIAIDVQNVGAPQNAVYEIEYMARIDLEEYKQVVPNSGQYRAAISHLIPPDADVVKVTAQSNYTDFYKKTASYFMKLWDWVDSQPTGNSQHGTIQVDELSYVGAVEYGYVNAMTCTLSNPHGSLRGKLVLELMADVSAASTLPSRQWTVTVESFKATPMSWLSLSKSGSAFADGGSDSLAVTATVPSGAMAGSHQAAFVASYDAKAATVVRDVGATAIADTEYLNTSLASTHWDDGSMGNYWDDYATKYPAAGNDGTVWDTPYEFDTPGKRDMFPLVVPEELVPPVLITSSPITITGNSDFQYVSERGDGTPGDPWVIEHLDINGSAFSQDGIYVKDTTDYFVISNCRITNTQGGYSGIYFENVTNGAVVDSLVQHGFANGITIMYSSTVKIQSSEILDNGQFGIYAEGSSAVHVLGNEASGNLGGLGIYLYTTPDSAIIGNVAYNNGVSILVGASNNVRISGNYIHDETTAIYIYDLTGNLVSDNVIDNMAGNSIYLDTMSGATYNNVITDNDFTNCIAQHAWDDDPTNSNNWDGNYWEDNAPYSIPYAGIADGGTASGVQDNAPETAPIAGTATHRTAIAPFEIAGDSDFATSPGVLNPGAAGIYSDPFVIAGWDIDATGSGYGIKIGNTTAHFVVLDCGIYGNPSAHGVALFNAPNGVVRSCDFIGLMTGAFIHGTSGSSIYWNSGIGLTMGVQAVSSDNVTVSYNKITAGTHGIVFQSSGWCTATMNWVGDTVGGGNSGNGLLMDHTLECSATLNEFASNGYGTHLTNSTGFNQLHHNNYYANGIQAYDDFVGETLPGFELFSAFGTPSDYWSAYDVLFCNVTYDGAVLIAGTHYTFDRNTGNITFTPALTGKSGGATVSVWAVLVYEESNPTLVALPNDRLTAAAASVEVYIHKLDGSWTKVPGANIVLHKNTGIIEMLTQFSIERGLKVFANYTYYNRTGIVPLTLSVYVATSAAFEFGDMDAAETPNIMPSWGVRPGQGTSLYSGDRRYFYAKIPNQGMFTVTELKYFYLYAEAMWGLNESDINIYIYGKGAEPIFEQGAPYSMSKLGGSDEKADFTFATATNGPKDIVMTKFNHEVLVICASGKSFNGTGGPITKFQGRVGWLRMSDNAPKTYTNQMVGHTGLSFQSNIGLSGVYASIVGPAQGAKTTEQIYQDDLSLYDLSTLEGWLTMNAVAGFTKVFTVENALSWDVRISGYAMCPDLDLALFYDGKAGQPKDGVAQWQEIITNRDMEFDAYLSSYGSGSYCYCADADAEEGIKIISPPDGDYIVKVLGFTVNPEPGLFDLEVKSIFAGVEGYKLRETNDFADESPEDGIYLSNARVQPFDIRGFEIQWTYPEETQDGSYAGIFVLGVPEAQKLVVISADIVLDRLAPEIVPGSTGPGTVSSNAKPTVSATTTDEKKGELSSVAEVYLDGREITQMSKVSIAETANSAGTPGNWGGILSYTPTTPMSEGGHYIEFVVRDFTGNMNRLGWGFTVDTMAPNIELDPAIANGAVTADESIVATGWTEPSATLTVFSGADVAWSNQYDDGTFMAVLPLVDGQNEVRFVSQDAAGNRGVKTIVVVHDTSEPTLTQIASSAGSLTSEGFTVITGKANTLGQLSINNAEVKIMPGDKTFSALVPLVEGMNAIRLAFHDERGFSTVAWKNVTRDSTAPTLAIATPDPYVRDSVYVVSGTMTDGSTLFVNGKSATMTGDEFSKEVTLSYGANTIVVEGRDSAGNSAFTTISVSYLPEYGTNWAAIGLIVGMLVLGLLLGFLLLRMMGPVKPKEPVPETEVPAAEELEVEGEQPEVGAEATPEVGEVADVPTAEEVPKETTPEEAQAVAEAEQIEFPSEGGAADLPPIPAEEAMPEELPVVEEPKVEPVEEQKPMEPTPELSKEAASQQPKPSLANEEKIARLKKALDEGKISQEMYELNLKKLQG